MCNRIEKSYRGTVYKQLQLCIGKIKEKIKVVMEISFIYFFEPLDFFINSLFIMIQIAVISRLITLCFTIPMFINLAFEYHV